MSSTDEIQPKRRRLGRGLNALIGTAGIDATEDTARTDDSLKRINVDQIQRNDFQPRQQFDEESLNELSKSIRQHGILQPLLVRPADDGYQLIAGERRWLAAKKAGLTTVPCQVRAMEDQQVTEAAIEENLKRKDLNVLEKAHAFQDYIDRFECTIERLAKRLSMTRSNVSNILRLLELSDEVKDSVRREAVSYGHARALLPLESSEQTSLCQRIQSESLTVRQTESAVREMQSDDPAIVPFPNKGSAQSPSPLTSHVLSLQDQLRDHLGAKVEIRLSGKDKGKIVIQFGSNDEFERIVRQLRRAAA